MSWMVPRVMSVAHVDHMTVDELDWSEGRF
jgi:hypothetical protein